MNEPQDHKRSGEDDTEEQDQGNVLHDDVTNAKRDPESEKIAQKRKEGPMGDMPRPSGEMTSNWQARKG